MSGKYEGDKCNRNRCNGIIKLHPVENCSCHIHPPYSECTSPRHFCDICGWEESDDFIINDFVVNIDRKTNTYRYSEQRTLDNTKIDWISKSDTNFSMIKEGVYPEGTTMAEIRNLVDGTFGGRFVEFGNGKFKFIAYTD